jgi:hypothetical protein
MRKKQAFLRAVPVRTPGDIELETLSSMSPPVLPKKRSVSTTFVSTKECCAQDILDKFKQRALKNKSDASWVIFHPRGDPYRNLLYEVQISVQYPQQSDEISKQ